MYEIRIRIEGDGQLFRVEHGFPALPATDTLVALKREAVDAFGALYPGATEDEVFVWVARLGDEI